MNLYTIKELLPTNPLAVKLRQFTQSAPIQPTSIVKHQGKLAQITSYYITDKGRTGYIGFYIDGLRKGKPVGANPCYLSSPVVVDRKELDTLPMLAPVKSGSKSLAEQLAERKAAKQLNNK
jgi:hypothetical protein